VSIALVGGERWAAADRWAALGAALMILYNAWRQLRPAILELGDVAPDPTLETRVREIARHVSGVVGLDKCFVRKMGFSYYVDLHVVVNGNLSVREGHKIAHRVEAMVLKTLPQVSEVLVHIETEKVDGDLRHHSVTVAVTNWEGREQPQP